MEALARPPGSGHAAVSARREDGRRRAPEGPTLTQLSYRGKEKGHCTGLNDSCQPIHPLAVKTANGILRSRRGKLAGKRMANGPVAFAAKAACMLAWQVDSRQRDLSGWRDLGSF